MHLRQREYVHRTLLIVYVRFYMPVFIFGDFHDLKSE